MMRKIIINQNQKGLLFKNGKYVKLVGPGKYFLCGNRQILLQSLDHSVICPLCSIEDLLRDEALKAQVERVEVKDERLMLHFVNGKFSDVLPRGDYLFWKDHGTHEFREVDISVPDVDASVPAYIFSMIPAQYFIKAEVADHQKGRLYVNRKFIRLLDAGTHYFWRSSARIDVECVDMRLTRMNVQGQEILTADKVSLRVNFVLNYRVTDPVRISTEVDDFEEQLHVASQLALREYVGKYKLDEILENKEEMSRFVFENLKAKESKLFVEITDAGVKDIILPGEIREIMNTVLVAEKRAQANVITRREEVASTRSLMNTAKLMDENKTLYKLKELEFIERICENVGNINLSGNGDMLTQLTAMLKS